MKRTITLIVAMSFALSMGGCSWFKKKSSSEPAMTEKSESKHSKKNTEKNKTMTDNTSKGVKKGKRILCNSKKTYAKGSPCWHWKRGARIGKPSK